MVTLVSHLLLLCLESLLSLLLGLSLSPVLCGTQSPKDLLGALGAGPMASSGLGWWLSPGSQGLLSG